MPFEITPDDITKSFPWRCKPEKGRFRSTENEEDFEMNSMCVRTHLGSSSGCGASRALPTGFRSASSAVTSASSASTFPLKITKKIISYSMNLYLPLIKPDLEFLPLSLEQSLATILDMSNEIIHRKSVILLPAIRLLLNKLTA